MPKIYPYVNTFNAGEISELLYNREDITKYKSACRILENAVPLVEGGAKKMPGTYFAGQALNEGFGPDRLVPFQFSTDQGAVLEFSYYENNGGGGSGGAFVATESAEIGLSFVFPIARNGSGTSPFKVSSLYNFAIPSTATITGIGVSFARRVTNLSVTATTDQIFLYKAGVQVGTPKTGAGDSWLTSLTPESYGSISDLWGTTWTPADINNASFGFGFDFDYNNASDTNSYDAIGAQYAITVYYTTPGGGGGGATKGTYIRIWEPTSPGTWTLGLVESGGFPIVLQAPYLQSELFELDCSAQSADVLWIFHPNYPPACIERLGANSWAYTLAPPGGNSGTPGNPAYRGTPDVVKTGFSGLGVSILQITQAFPLVLVTDVAFSYGDRVYINLCSGMVELNEGEFFITPVLNSGTLATFSGSITGGISTEQGTILTVASVSSGTILVGMQVTGPNVSPGTIITEYLSGSGGAGTYQVNNSQLVQGSTQMNGQGGFAYNLVPADTGVLFTGSISATVLTVTSVAAGVIQNGVGLYFPGVPAGTQVTSFGTGTGGVGTYNISPSQSAGSQKMSSVPIVSTSYLTYTGGGFAVKVIPFFAMMGDYPACGTFYQNRLCVSGTDNNPNTVYGSVVGDFPDFIADPNEDDHSFQFTLVSTLLDQVLSLIGTPTTLMLGTAGGVWVMTGTPGSSLSQSNVASSKQTTIGVGRMQPQLCGDAAIFISRDTREVMFLVFNFTTNEWDNYDLTRLNRNITIGASKSLSGITQTAFQVLPYPIFWAVRADGQLLGLVFNRQDQVYAWFRVNMQPTGGIVESVAVITGQNEEDMVVVIVNRTINGQTVRYVEYFMPQELFNDLSNAFFVYCGLQLNLGSAINITGINNGTPCVVTAPGHNFANGSFVQIMGVLGMTQINQDKTQAYTVVNTNPGAGTFQLQGMDTTSFGVYTGGGTALPVTNVVTGMSYLLGRTVTAVGDEALILPPTVVTSDTLTFMYYCAQITVGIPYTIIVQPTNPILSTQGQTTRGMKQKPYRVTISLYESMGGQYGVDPTHLYDIVYGPGTQGQQPQMSTFESSFDLDADWDEATTLYIEQGDPFPFTLRGLVIREDYNQS